MDTMNTATVYTMINPEVTALQYEGTEDHAEALLVWVREVMEDDRIDLQFRDERDGTTTAYFVMEPDNEDKDLKVLSTDWLVLKVGHEDNKPRLRVWKDDNFGRTFRKRDSL